MVGNLSFVVIIIISDVYNHVEIFIFVMYHSLLSSFLRKLRNQVWNLKEFFDFQDVLPKSRYRIFSLFLVRDLS